MRHFTLMILLVGLAITNNYAAVFNPMISLYSPFFGSQDASSKYQKLVQQAYNDYGQSGCTIPVKKMNMLVQNLLAGNYIPSRCLASG